jgi:CubicO group peptidase (beta-lactamase class C family)
MLPLLALLATLPLDVLQAAHAAGTFDGEVLVARDGKVTTHAALGLLDRERKVPHAPGTVWRWASITKQLTAVLVLQEVERGRLDLDAPLARVLPAFRGPTRDSVTVRMLLQHTSGLPNPDDTPPSRDGGWPSFYERPVANAALTLCAGPVRSASPGTAFSYDNCDYLVLGAVLERLSGRSWAALVQERLAGPLKLASLQVAPPSPVVGINEDGSREGGFVLANLGPAGALGGTLQDLFRFDEALRTGALLAPASLALLWKGEPRFGFAALGQWSYSVPLEGCAGPVHLVERRGSLGGQEVVNVIAPERHAEVLVFSSTARTAWGQVWEGKGLLHDVLAAALCGEGA